jgi:hypothetical protein
VDASEPDSCDVAAWLAGDKVYWEAMTEKGGAFTAEFRTFSRRPMNATGKRERGKESRRHHSGNLPSKN